VAKTNPTVAAFNGGEVDKESLARVDLDLYSRVCEQMENIFPYTQGKMSKVPGSIFLDDITALAEVTEEDGDVVLDEAGDPVLTEGDSLGVVRAFVRSDELAYVLELSANQIRFILGEDYVTIDGAATTLGAWSDQTAAPPTGGDPPIDPGYSDVSDPFYPDFTYLITGENGGLTP
jgi:hypothetical protein